MASSTTGVSQVHDRQKVVEGNMRNSHRLALLLITSLVLSSLKHSGIVFLRESKSY